VSPAETLAHQQTQVAGQIGIGIVDRLVLADHAAQLGGDRARPRSEHRIGQDLIRR
jgi:hypothetical protein